MTGAEMPTEDYDPEEDENGAEDYEEYTEQINNYANNHHT